MSRSGISARLCEIQRIADQTGRGEAALAAAMIAQALHDALMGVPGTVSDPREARRWLKTTGARWLALLGSADH
jgi:hypothetical protein